MMGWNYGAGGSLGAFNPLGSVFEIIILVDFVLLGVWLWKQIGKK